MPDVQGLLADPEFQALPEERKRVLLERIGASQPVPPPRPPMSEADITAYMQSPEFQQAREQGMEAGAAEAAGPIMGMMGTAALGAGALPVAARLATNPMAVGVGRAAYGLATGESVPGAAMEGVEAAGWATAAKLGGGKVAEKILEKVPMPAILRAKLAHTLARGVKVAKEEAPVVPKPSTAPAKVVPIRAEVKPPSLDDVAHRVRELDVAKLSRGQIAEQLRSEFAPGQRGIGVGYFRRFTDQLLDAAKVGK